MSGAETFIFRRPRPLSGHRRARAQHLTPTTPTAKSPLKYPSCLKRTEVRLLGKSPTGCS